MSDYGTPTKMEGTGLGPVSDYGTPTKMTVAKRHSVEPSDESRSQQLHQRHGASQGSDTSMIVGTSGGPDGATAIVLSGEKPADRKLSSDSLQQAPCKQATVKMIHRSATPSTTKTAYSTESSGDKASFKSDRYTMTDSWGSVVLSRDGQSVAYRSKSTMSETNEASLRELTDSGSQTICSNDSLVAPRRVSRIAHHVLRSNVVSADEPSSKSDGYSFVDSSEREGEVKPVAHRCKPTIPEVPQESLTEFASTEGETVCTNETTVLSNDVSSDIPRKLVSKLSGQKHYANHGSSKSSELETARVTSILDQFVDNSVVKLSDENIDNHITYIPETQRECDGQTVCTNETTVSPNYVSSDITSKPVSKLNGQKHDTIPGSIRRSEMETARVVSNQFVDSSVETFSDENKDNHITHFPETQREYDSTCGLPPRTNSSVDIQRVQQQHIEWTGRESTSVDAVGQGHIHSTKTVQTLSDQVPHHMTRERSIGEHPETIEQATMESPVKQCERRRSITSEQSSTTHEATSMKRRRMLLSEQSTTSYPVETERPSTSHPAMFAGLSDESPGQTKHDEAEADISEMALSAVHQLNDDALSTNQETRRPTEDIHLFSAQSKQNKDVSEVVRATNTPMDSGQRKKRSQRKPKQMGIRCDVGHKHLCKLCGHDKKKKRKQPLTSTQKDRARRIINKAKGNSEYTGRIDDMQPVVQPEQGGNQMVEDEVARDMNAVTSQTEELEVKAAASPLEGIPRTVLRKASIEDMLRDLESRADVFLRHRSTSLRYPRLNGDAVETKTTVHDRHVKMTSTGTTMLTSCKDVVVNEAVMYDTPFHRRNTKHESEIRRTSTQSHASGGQFLYSQRDSVMPLAELGFSDDNKSRDTDLYSYIDNRTNWDDELESKPVSISDNLCTTSREVYMEDTLSQAEDIIHGAQNKKTLSPSGVDISTSHDDRREDNLETFSKIVRGNTTGKSRSDVFLTTSPPRMVYIVNAPDLAECSRKETENKETVLSLDVETSYDYVLEDKTVSTLGESKKTIRVRKPTTRWNDDSLFDYSHQNEFNPENMERRSAKWQEMSESANAPFLPRICDVQREKQTNRHIHIIQKETTTMTRHKDNIVVVNENVLYDETSRRRRTKGEANNLRTSTQSHTKEVEFLYSKRDHSIPLAEATHCSFSDYDTDEVDVPHSKHDDSVQGNRRTSTQSLTDEVDVPHKKYDHSVRDNLRTSTQSHTKEVVFLYSKRDHSIPLAEATHCSFSDYDTDEVDVPHSKHDHSVRGNRRTSTQSDTDEVDVPHKKYDHSVRDNRRTSTQSDTDEVDVPHKKHDHSVRDNRGTSTQSHTDEVDVPHKKHDHSVRDNRRTSTQSDTDEVDVPHKKHDHSVRDNRGTSTQSDTDEVDVPHKKHDHSVRDNRGTSTQSHTDEVDVPHKKHDHSVRDNRRTSTQSDTDEVDVPHKKHDHSVRDNRGTSTQSHTDEVDVPHKKHDHSVRDNRRTSIQSHTDEVDVPHSKHDHYVRDNRRTSTQSHTSEVEFLYSNRDHSIPLAEKTHCGFSDYNENSETVLADDFGTNLDNAPDHVITLDDYSKTVPATPIRHPSDNSSFNYSIRDDCSDNTHRQTECNANYETVKVVIFPPDADEDNALYTADDSMITVHGSSTVKICSDDLLTGSIPQKGYKEVAVGVAGNICVTKTSEINFRRYIDVCTSYEDAHGDKDVSSLDYFNTNTLRQTIVRCHTGDLSPASAAMGYSDETLKQLPGSTGYDERKDTMLSPCVDANISYDELRDDVVVSTLNAFTMTVLGGDTWNWRALSHPERPTAKPQRTLSDRSVSYNTYTQSSGRDVETNEHSTNSESGVNIVSTTKQCVSTATLDDGIAPTQHVAMQLKHSYSAKSGYKLPLKSKSAMADVSFKRAPSVTISGFAQYHASDMGVMSMPNAEEGRGTQQNPTVKQQPPRCQTQTGISLHTPGVTNAIDIYASEPASVEVYTLPSQDPSGASANVDTGLDSTVTGNIGILLSGLTPESTHDEIAESAARILHEMHQVRPYILDVFIFIL